MSQVSTVPPHRLALTPGAHRTLYLTHNLTYHICIEYIHPPSHGSTDPIQVKPRVGLLVWRPQKVDFTL